MAESGHDDLADALSRMASGDHAPSEHLHDETPPPAPVPVKPVAQKAAPAVRPTPPAGQPAAATPKARPVTPAPQQATARPAAPARPATTPAARAPPPAGPTPAVSPVAATPAAPGARPARPTAPAARPTAPVVAAPVPVEEPAAVIDDDDAVIVPAYESSKLARPSNAAAQLRAAKQKRKNLEFRRTCIPVLLTTGALMFVFGMAKFLIGDESSLSALPNTIPLVLFVGGLVMLGLAAVNMISVQKEMAADAAAGE
jgi:hypothetical protein